MVYDIETYVQDWTAPLPDQPKTAWVLRVDLETEMHAMRMRVVASDTAERKRRHPHTYLKRTSHRYRALMRLATRLNLLLRYYGFDGGRRRQSASDFLPMLYKAVKSFEGLTKSEKRLLKWVEMFCEERGMLDSLQGAFPPDAQDKRAYSDIRDDVLASFTGDLRYDLAQFEDTPEWWVAQDEWHTERIRRDREARQQDVEEEEAEPAHRER